MADTYCKADWVLAKIKEWADANSFKMNSSTITPKGKTFPRLNDISMENDTTEVNNSINILGASFSKNLTGNEHAEFLCSKLLQQYIQLLEYRTCFLKRLKFYSTIY